MSIVVGMIIGVWIASGTAPKLICYGLTLLNPSIFLAAAMVLRRIAPLPALFSGVVAGALVAIFYQGVGLHDVFTYAQSGFAIDTGVAEIDKLLNAGGIQSMV